MTMDISSLGIAPEAKVNSLQLKVSAFIAELNRCMADVNGWRPIVQGYSITLTQTSQHESNAAITFWGDLRPFDWPLTSHIKIRIEVYKEQRRAAIVWAGVNAGHLAIERHFVSIMLDVIEFDGYIVLRLSRVVPESANVSDNFKRERG